MGRDLTLYLQTVLSLDIAHKEGLKSATYMTRGICGCQN